MAIEAGLISLDDNQAAAIDAIENRLNDILSQIEIPIDRVRSQLDDSMIQNLAQDATEEWTGTFNPREMSVADFAQLYRDTFIKGSK